MWQAIKSKLIINLEIPILNKIIDLICENLVAMAESD